MAPEVYFRRLKLLSAGLYLVFIGRTAFLVEGKLRFTLVDDAMISMVYARHFAEGHGLVWNVAEPPIEGFTNLLWTLLMAALHAIGLPATGICLGLMLLGAALLLALQQVVRGIANEVSTPDGFVSRLSATLVAFYFPVSFWTLRGMETGALTLLVSSATLLVLRAGTGVRTVGYAGLCLAFAQGLRPDVLPAALVLGAYVLGRHGLSRAMVFGVGPAVATLGLLLFRLWYFGGPVPNTYHLKMEGVSTWARVGAGLHLFGRVALLDLAVPFALLVLRRPRLRAGGLLAALFGTQVAYSIYAGGDYAELNTMGVNRYLVQAMPVFFVLVAASVARLRSELATATSGFRKLLGGRSTARAALVILLAMSGDEYARWVVSNAPLWRDDVRRAELGLWLARHTPLATRVAVHAAGQTPYYSDRYSIDMLGKSDAHVARMHQVTSFRAGHNKWDYHHSVIEQQADLVVHSWGQLPVFMATRPEFVPVDLPTGAWVRRDSRAAASLLAPGTIQAAEHEKTRR